MRGNRSFTKVSTSLRRVFPWQSRLQNVESYTEEEETFDKLEQSRTKTLNADFMMSEDKEVVMNERRFYEVFEELKCAARDAERLYWLKDCEHFEVTPDDVEKLRELEILNNHNHTVLTYNENPVVSLFVERDQWSEVHRFLNQKPQNIDSSVLLASPGAGFAIRLDYGEDPKFVPESHKSPFLLVIRNRIQADWKDAVEDKLKSCRELDHPEKLWLENRTEKHDLVEKRVYLLEFWNTFDRNNALWSFECIDTLYVQSMSQTESLTKEYVLRVSFNRTAIPDNEVRVVLEHNCERDHLSLMFIHHGCKTRFYTPDRNEFTIITFPAHLITFEECCWFTERVCEANNLTIRTMDPANVLPFHHRDPLLLQNSINQDMDSMDSRRTEPQRDANGDRRVEMSPSRWMTHDVTRPSDDSHIFCVTFKYLHDGEQLVPEAIRRSYTEQVFKHYGTRTKIMPIFKTTFAIDRTVRNVCDKIIRELDNKFTQKFVNLMQQADERMCQPEAMYYRLRICEKWLPGSGSGVIGVEGWPKQDVEESVRELKNALRNVEFAAHPDLFYGIGEAYAYSLMEKYAGTVLIDVDKYQNLIHLIGSSANDAIEDLRGFEEKKGSIHINVEIPLFSINRPGLLREHISLAGNYLGADVRMIGDSTIEFDGTVHAFTTLMAALDNYSSEVFRLETGELPAQFVSSCSVCHNEIGATNNFYRPNCGHCLCRECANLKIRSSIDSSNFKVHCDLEACQKPWTPDEILYIVLGGTRRLRALDNQKLAKLMARAKQFILDSNTSVVTCPTADCVGILYKSPSYMMTLKECLVCNHLYCSDCLAPDHDNRPCYYDNIAPVRQLVEENGDGEVKRCPRCHEAIVKAAGCNHVECRCGAHFCWVCLFLAPTMASCYEHLRTVHGGFDDRWAGLDDGMMANMANMVNMVNMAHMVNMANIVNMVNMDEAFDGSDDENV